MRRGTWSSRQGKGDLKRASHCGGKVDGDRSRDGGTEAGVLGSAGRASHMWNARFSRKEMHALIVAL